MLKVFGGRWLCERFRRGFVRRVTGNWGIAVAKVCWSLLWREGKVLAGTGCWDELAGDDGGVNARTIKYLKLK